MLHAIKENRYADELVGFADMGLRYVVGCTEPDRNPTYMGYPELGEAVAAANQLEEHSDHEFSVIELIQDERGDWFSDFEDKRI